MTAHNNFKLKDCRFRLAARKPIFTMSVMRHWNKLFRETVDDPWKCSSQIGWGFKQSNRVKDVQGLGRGVGLDMFKGLDDRDYLYIISIQKWISLFNSNHKVDIPNLSQCKGKNESFTSDLVPLGFLCGGRTLVRLIHSWSRHLKRVKWIIPWRHLFSFLNSKNHLTKIL